MHIKPLNIFISILFVLFSFFYTNKIINYFRSKDPIMIEIKKYDELYLDTKKESIIENNSIIPGIDGMIVDIDKSYKNMKKTGKFDKNLLVFKESTPEIKINYNNYIISLNKTQNNVSLLFELKDTSYIDNILSILNNKNIKVTFFVPKDLFDNNIDSLKKITRYGHDIELLSNNYSIYEVNKYNSTLKLISNDILSFCLNINKNDELLKKCESSKLYSITPSINYNNNIYLNIKKYLEDGSIILLKNNKKTIDELSSTLNYIKQKGKNIILIKNIIA